MRGKSFTQKVVHVWNELPEEVVNAALVTMFKRHLDKYMNKGGLERYGPGAGSCKEKQNLFSFFAIIMGLCNAAISRLCLTWE
eukprot:g37089.t1